MKKRIAILMMAVTMMGTLAGCGGKTECDFCAEEKRCQIKNVWGEEVHYCSDCLDEINDFFK